MVFVGVPLLALGALYLAAAASLFPLVWRERRRMRELEVTLALIFPCGGLAAATFGALALIDLRQFREFAFAMFVGILLDAFVIRSLLIPALISLVGERSWWPWRPAGQPEPAQAPALSRP